VWQGNVGKIYLVRGRDLPVGVGSSANGSSANGSSANGSSANGSSADGSLSGKDGRLFAVKQLSKKDLLKRDKVRLARERAVGRTEREPLEALQGAAGERERAERAVGRIAAKRDEVW
jgi:hypothetical protein